MGCGEDDGSQRGCRVGVEWGAERQRTLQGNAGIDAGCDSVFRCGADGVFVFDCLDLVGE